MRYRGPLCEIGYSGLALGSGPLSYLFGKCSFPNCSRTAQTWGHSFWAINTVVLFPEYKTEGKAIKQNYVGTGKSSVLGLAATKQVSDASRLFPGITGSAQDLQRPRHGGLPVRGHLQGQYK